VRLSQKIGRETRGSESSGEEGGKMKGRDSERRKRRETE